MRFSITTGVIYGALAASALTIPRNDCSNEQPCEDDKVSKTDLKPFQAVTFKMITPEEAKSREEEGVLPGKSEAECEEDNKPRPSTLVGDPVKVTVATSIHNSAVGDQVQGNASPKCTNPAIRVEWRNMADNDKKVFVDAVKCLMNKPASGNFPGATNRYEDIVLVHQKMRPTVHGLAQFMHWHRYYLHIYESILREECQYKAPMPWWDETRDAGNFAKAPVFTAEYFGPLPDKTGNNGQCVGDTGFVDPPVLHIGPGDTNTEHCLLRAGDESTTNMITRDIEKSCMAHAQFWDMAECVEQGPHAYGHNGIGGVMADASASPSDPIFWMHHAYVDHIHRIWTNGDPENRLYQANGNTTHDDHSPQLTLDFKLTSMGLMDDVTVRDVADTMGGYLCYRYDY